MPLVSCGLVVRILEVADQRHRDGTHECFGIGQLSHRPVAQMIHIGSSIQTPSKDTVDELRTPTSSGPEDAINPKVMIRRQHTTILALQSSLQWIVH